jgi:hypothetical protein
VKLPSLSGFAFTVHGPTSQMALLEKFRDAADRAWQAEIVTDGWPAPVPDGTSGGDAGFDIYYDSALGLGEAYVVPDGDMITQPDAVTASYMGLPADFADDDDLFSTVAHELNHASQFAIDALEDDAFFEHTAVFVERRVAHHLPTWGIGLGDYQAHPERALDYIGTDEYEYGAALWLIFLSERLDAGGVSLVERLWHDSAQPGTSNHPHFLDALDGILRDTGWSRGRFFAELAAWRWFTGARSDGKHFADGALWPAVAAGDTVSAPAELAATLGAFGVRYTVIDSGDGLDVQLGGDGAAAAFVPLDGGEPVFVDGTSATLPAGRWLAALVWAPAAYDPNTDDARTGNVTLSVSLVAAAPTSPAPSTGCQLARGEPPRGWPIAILLCVTVGCAVGASLRRGGHLGGMLRLRSPRATARRSLSVARSRD